VTPETAGLERAPVEALSGNSAEESAHIARQVLDGERGPRRDVVLLNAAAALVVAGRASDLRQGAQMAAKSIGEGRAAALLDRVRSLSWS
jgi:anthranilate phosphoribosyltransferase